LQTHRCTLRTTLVQADSRDYSVRYTGELEAGMAESTTYEELRERVRKLQESGELSKELTAEEKIDWAFGNTVIENESVTRAMVETAYATKHGE
jgi:hypothetical protein